MAIDAPTPAQQLEEVRQARDLAMHYAAAAPVPLCGDFARIAQSLDAAMPMMERALAALEAVEWRPIESAPKDGTSILITGGTYSTNWDAGLEFHGVSIAYWCRGFEPHWRGNNLQAHDEWCRHQPTHWMPLPAAHAREVEALQLALDNEQAKGVHSCGVHCERPLCVARREIASLRQRGEAAEAKLRAWSPIIYEIDRRAEKACCLEDRCDFTVIIDHDDYAAISGERV